MKPAPELRPDHEMEGQVGAWLTDTDLTAAETEAGLEQLLDEFPVTPQLRPGLLGRLLDRDEGAARPDDHPPRPRAPRQRLLVSVSALTAALLLVLAVGVMDLERSPDRNVLQLVVAADGSAEYDTIQAAVDAADDGDVVSVQPGVYVESLMVRSDITIAGDGLREEIILVAPEAGPVHAITHGPAQPYALALMGSNAEISGLTLRGATSSLLVDGGDPILRDLQLLSVAQPHIGVGRSDHNAVVIAGGSRATLSSSLFDAAGPVGVYDSEPSIVGNIFRGGSHIWGRFGDLGVIRDNHIDGALIQAINIQRSGPILIEGNVITGLDVGGIEVGLKGNSDARIRGNRIVGASTGISVREGDQAEVSGNELVDNGIGVRISRSDGQVMNNHVSGGDAGIVVVSGGSPNIADNIVDVSGRGIVAGARTSPVISRNQVCGGDESIRIADGASPELAANRLCEPPRTNDPRSMAEADRPARIGMKPTSRRLIR